MSIIYDNGLFELFGIFDIEIILFDLIYCTAVKKSVELK